MSWLEDDAIARAWDAMHNDEPEDEQPRCFCGELLEAADQRASEDGIDMCPPCSREHRPIRLHEAAE